MGQTGLPSISGMSLNLLKSVEGICVKAERHISLRKEKNNEINSIRRMKEKRRKMSGRKESERKCCHVEM